MTEREYNASVDLHDSYYAAVAELRQQREAAKVPAVLPVVHVPATLADAETSLKQIVVAEAAEKHWKAAKDPEKLFEAVKLKLTKQAGYVVYRQDVAVPSQAIGAPGRGKRVAVPRPVLPDADPGKRIVHRWRQRLCEKEGKRWVVSDDKLGAALEEAGRRSVRICEQENANTIRGTEGTGEFERYTPAEYIERARRVLGTIDLDPASSPIAQQTVRATRFFTETDNGLEQPWDGNVWLNPPYHRELAPLFIDKLIDEIAAGRTHQAIVLTNNSTDTQWFFRAAAACYGICFTTGRIHFTVPNAQPVLPTQGQAFFYYGRNLNQFVKVFSEIGFCVEPIYLGAPLC